MKGKGRKLAEESAIAARVVLGSLSADDGEQEIESSGVDALFAALGRVRQPLIKSF